MKISSVIRPNLQKTGDFVTLTEEVLCGKLDIFCSGCFHIFFFRISQTHLFFSDPIFLEKCFRKVLAPALWYILVPHKVIVISSI